MTGRYKSFCVASTALSFLLAGAAAPLHAQSADVVSRAVVQPLPPAASDDLNEALMRLARDRRDVDALISAGLASLQLDDVDAAIGFFGRAKELSPENARISEGMGAAYVRGGRPVEALKFFEEADRAGIATGTLWADRGLAYDLVGQNSAAQTAYGRAISLKDEDSVRQRLALSYAIAGDRQSFEQTLKPQLDEQDFAAYRTRAFGLAVLGDAEEAIEIARAVMPRDMAGRLEPYLRFMPRLTKSQQAAAANLGIYPSASRIGRDDPRIASAAGALSVPGSSDAALEPQGEALGARVAVAQTPSEPAANRRSRRSRSRDKQPEQEAQLKPGEVRLAVGTRIDETPVGPPANDQPAQLAAAAPPVEASVPAAAMGQPESRQRAPISFTLQQGRPRNLPTMEAPAPAPAPIPTPTPTPAPVQVAVASAPSQPSASASPSANVPQEPTRDLGALDLATAFADFSEPVAVAVASDNAVDISTIKPKREKPVEAAPPPPPAPKRIWLQLGIGQNRTLLRSDWRLKYRKYDVLKGKGPFVTPLGQTNRLLAGPFESQADARAALNALAADDVDSFIWTSPEGQEIDDLR